MNSQTSRLWRKFWIWVGVHRLWFFGSIWVIVNGYVRRGDDESTWLPGSLLQYIRQLLLKPSLCVLFSWGFVCLGVEYGLIIEIDKLDPFLLIGSVFPNTLGFGIGVYALMFALPERFFKKMAEDKISGKRSVGPNGFNSIMAFPLCVHALLVMTAPIASILNVDKTSLKIIGLGAFVYGMMLMIELVAVLYLSARAILPPKS